MLWIVLVISLSPHLLSFFASSMTLSHLLIKWAVVHVVTEYATVMLSLLLLLWDTHGSSYRMGRHEKGSDGCMGRHEKGE